MSVLIEPIKIVLRTNIPEKEEIIFEKSLLYIPDEKEKSRITLEKYPYITFDTNYSMTSLFKLTYLERIEFFFNKNVFEKNIGLYSKKFVSEENKSQDKKKYYEEQYEIIEKNILTMMTVLFPTRFPVVRDVHNSYDIVKKGYRFKDILFKPWKNEGYSYMKINGKTYTVKKVVWLNDLLNHPLYKDFIKESYLLYKWKDNELKKYDEKIDGSLMNILTTQVDELKNLKNLNSGDKKIENKLKKLENKKKDFEKITKSITEFFNNTKDIDDIDIDIPPQIVNYYKRTLLKFKNPNRDSSNMNLQNFITDTSDDDREKYFDTIKQLYEYYFKIKDENNVNLNFDNIKPLVNDYMNVGVSYIDTNTNKMREIYVMMDFIEGQVDSTNENQLKCMFSDDYLANYVNQLFIYMRRDPNIDARLLNDYPWDVAKNRVIFSIKDNEMKIVAEKTKNVSDENYNKQQNVSSSNVLKPTNKKPVINITSVDEGNINFWITQQIFKPINNIADNTGNSLKDYQTIITDINKMNIENIGGNVYEYIKKKNTKLYEILKKYYDKKDNPLFPRTIQDELMKLQNNISTNISTYDRHLKDAEYVKLYPNNIIKEKYEMKMNLLFKIIIDRLIFILDNNMKSKKQKIDVLNGGFYNYEKTKKNVFKFINKNGKNKTRKNFYF